MSSPDPKKFYVTTPIYYVNARPHIGHAYTTIVADVLARRHRLAGTPTFFLTGTDEHGQKIERSAAAAGIPPQQFADEVSASFRALWDRMGLTYDRYIRTTDPAHKAGAQYLFQTLFDRGQIYLGSYTGQYSVGEEMFVEGPPGTLGPDGKPTETVTEENFFFKLSEFQRPLLDLLEDGANGEEPILKITPESSRNEVLSFLRGNVYDAMFDALCDDNTTSSGDESTRARAQRLALEQGHLAKSALGFLYVPGALKDLSVSRSSFTWGIPVPQAVLDAAGATQPHVIYVWLDALANYMTAIGYGSRDPQAQAEFKKWWPADLHLVGKEITRFHCIYWPAFLLALNPKLQHATNEPMPNLSPEEHALWAKEWLPKQITANGWLLFDNAKMSKSRGNVVRTETILDAFGQLCPALPLNAAAEEKTPDSDHVEDETRKGTASAVPQDTARNEASASEIRPPTAHERDLFAADVLRYFLLREIPFGQDGSFSFDAMVTRYNADLANGYGNLVSRTLKLIETSFQGSVPYATKSDGSERDDVGLSIRKLTSDFVYAFPINAAGVSTKICEQGFSEALADIGFLIASADLYLAATKPWILAKKADGSVDFGDLPITLYTAAEAIRILTALLYPILPFATARVWAQLGLGDIEQAAKDGKLNNLQWGGLKPGTPLGPLSPIFPRADKGLAQLMIDMEDQKNATAATATPDTASAAAAPRTASLDEPTGTLPVAGSAAQTTRTGEPAPSQSDIPASGIFRPAAAASTAAPSTPEDATDTTPQITIDDFVKIDLRVAEILVCERIPKADKLLRLEVDLGPGFTPSRRQILSGIAEWYTPEELIGRRIAVITNLAPRKMRGLESHGMLLAASEGEGGKPVLATFGEAIAVGSRIK